MEAEQVEEDGFVYTVEEALTTLGIGKFQYMVMCYASLGFIAEAAETMILSFIGPALSIGQCQHSSIAFHTNDDQSLYTNVLINSLAEIPGILLSAIMVEKVGRKFTMALMYALYFLFLLPLLGPQLPALTIACLFGARTFILGSFVILGVYYREVCTLGKRIDGIWRSSWHSQNNFQTQEGTWSPLLRYIQRL